MENQKIIDKEKRERENAEFWELYKAASPEKQRQVRVMLGLEKAPAEAKTQGL